MVTRSNIRSSLSTVLHDLRAFMVANGFAAIYLNITTVKSPCYFLIC